MWNSQESERRLRDPIAGRRDRCGTVSSSAPPRPNLPTTGPVVTSPGLANRILGAGGTGEELEEPVPPVEPAIELVFEVRFSVAET